LSKRVEHYIISPRSREAEEIESLKNGPAFLKCPIRSPYGVAACLTLSQGGSIERIDIVDPPPFFATDFLRRKKV
jgi:hypothetical protein